MIKRTLIIPFCLTITLTTLLPAKAYISNRGRWEGKGFTLQANHGDIYDLHSNRTTGYRWSIHRGFSFFKIRAKKGFLIKEESTITVKNQTKVFRCLDEPNSFRQSVAIRFPGHVKFVRIKIRLLEKKSGKTVVRKHRLKLIRRKGSYSKYRVMDVREL